MRNGLTIAMLMMFTHVMGQGPSFTFSAERIHPGQQIPWYGELAATQNYSQGEFVELYSSRYLKDAKSQFREIKRTTDELGFTHIRLQQFYGEHKVVHGVLNIHMRGGRVESFNGEIYQVNSPAAEGEIPAYNEVKERFLSANPGYANFLWLDEEKNRAPVYCPNDDGSEVRLAYAFRMASPKGTIDNLIYYDVFQLSRIRLEPQIVHADSLGTAKTHYRGTRKITTDYTGSDFRLKETVRPIKTYRTMLGNYITDSDNYWNTSGLEIAGDVHWGVELVHDFMDETFGWNSYANNGDSMSSVLNFSGTGNAFWNLGGNYATFLVGSSSSIKPCASLDVVGHEFGHGIADENAGLVYSGESCMLHESFADINGSIIEYYADSSKANWLIGDEVWTGSGGIRNMKNPSAFAHPDTYKGNNWGSGCHSNGGVQNYWFYLMVEGGSGTNDNALAYNIKGLGRDTTIQILYRAMFYYATPNTNFHDMAAHTLKATKDLYGSCGGEMQMVWDAWEAVGVIDTTVQMLNLNHGIIAPELRCADVPADQVFKSKGDVNREVFWDFGMGDTTRDLNPKRHYTDYGAQTITLRTKVCHKVFYDTLNYRINAQPEASFAPNRTEFCRYGDDTLTCTNLTIEKDSSQQLLYKWRIEPYDVNDTSTHLILPMKGKDHFFSVALTAYYPTGCESIKREFYQVSEIGEANFTTKSICVGDTINVVNKTDTSRKTTFNWTVSGSSQIGPYEFIEVFEPRIVLEQSQKVTIQLDAFDTATGCTTSHTETIDIFTNPVPSFTVENPCMNDTMVFRNTTSHDTTITWIWWDFGNYTPFDKQVVTRVPETSDSMIVGLRVRADNGCNVILYDTIGIENVRASFDWSDQCLNNQKTFINTSTGNGLSYAWNFGNGEQSTDTNGIVEYAKTGKYKVSLTSKSANCTSVNEQEIEIFHVPEVDFSFDGVCQEDITQFVGESNAKEGRYTWYFGDGDTSQAINPAHTYDIDQTTSFFTRLVVEDKHGCTNDTSKVVTINQLPHCGFSWSYEWPSRDVRFTVDSGGYVSYSWDFDDGNTSDQKNPVHDFASDTGYYVTLVSTDKEGCSCSKTTWLAGGNSSVSDLGLSKLKLYPNPNPGEFTIEGLEPGIYNVSIISANGQHVWQGNIEATGVTRLENLQLTTGLYQVILAGPEQNAQLRFMVE